MYRAGLLIIHDLHLEIECKTCIKMFYAKFALQSRSLLNSITFSGHSGCNFYFMILAICPISSFLPKEIGFWPYTFLVDFDLSQVTFDPTNKKAIQISIRDYSTIVNMIYCRGPPPGVRKKKKPLAAPATSITFTSTIGKHKGRPELQYPLGITHSVVIQWLSNQNEKVRTDQNYHGTTTE